jgi:hypothetical protein
LRKCAPWLLLDVRRCSFTEKKRSSSVPDWGSALKIPSSQVSAKTDRQDRKHSSSFPSQPSTSYITVITMAPCRCRVLWMPCLTGNKYSHKYSQRQPTAPCKLTPWSQSAFKLQLARFSQRRELPVKGDSSHYFV